MSFGLRPCGLQGWAVCDGNCEECGTTATTTTDGYWYHGNGKIGGEFHPTKPNDEERYGEYVKVKHGRWVDVEPAPWGQVYETCSECGTRQTLDKGNDNFCGVCGAKMDLDKV